MFNFIEGVRLSQMCDYSFGDQGSIICGIYGGYMKIANYTNSEFINRVDEISKSRNYMTLFIDNIRLYQRSISVRNTNDQIWLDKLTSENDLLSLCSNFPRIRFIIFTNLEDTPIDEQIEGKVPENVFIFAANAIYHNDRIFPAPYGIQRKMNPSDNRESLLFQIMNESISITNLLYINHNVNTNLSERNGIYDIFREKSWVSIDETRQNYDNFLRKIKSHKFMICPIGNAIDCHRNWEVLYLRRVPIMKKNRYLEYLFREYPVLFVDDYSEVTEDLLNESNSLYEDALTMNIEKLKIDVFFQNCISTANYR